MKNYLIAGAGKGIGLAAARQLAAESNLCTISRHDTEELQSLNTHFYQLDILTSNLDELAALPDVIHGLLYCPGSITLKPFTRLTEEDFVNDYRQNVWGTVKLIQKILPQLKKADGAAVVLFSSVAAKVGMPFHASIASAKAGVEGLTKSLAAEFAASKIRVNAIAPSLTDTPLAQSLLNTPEKKETAAKRHPIKRIGDADDLAALACFLLSDKSNFITGQIIGADGGLGTLQA